MRDHRDANPSPHSGCTYCGDLLAGRFDRRRFLIATASGLAAVALGPALALAGPVKYEAMVLSCIDPRFQEPVRRHLAGRDLTGQYSQFAIAGAAVGVVAPAFRDWHKTFWDNLGASIQLHAINRVIVVNHRDCGAARIAYGDAAVATPEAETRTHGEALAEFRRQLKERHPALGAETGIMALDGTFQPLG